MPEGTLRGEIVASRSNGRLGGVLGGFGAEMSEWDGSGVLLGIWISKLLFEI